MDLKTPLVDLSKHVILFLNTWSGQDAYESQTGILNQASSDTNKADNFTSLKNCSQGQHRLPFTEITLRTLSVKLPTLLTIHFMDHNTVAMEIAHFLWTVFNVHN